MLSSPPISLDEYQSIISKGTVFHECSEKTVNGVAFIQAIELKNRSIKETTKEVLAHLARSLSSAQNLINNLDSKYCIRVLKEFCNEIQNIQAKILQSHPISRRQNIKKIFNQNDLEFVKSMTPDKVIVLTKFSPVSIKIKRLDAFCNKCHLSHTSLKDFSFTTGEEYLVLAGKKLLSHK